MKYSRLIYKFLFQVLVLIPVLVSAQPKDNSPYSRYGIGDIQSRNFNYLESMGSLGSSFNDRYFINATNPASYAFLDVTAFDIGFNAKYSLLDDGIKQGIWSGNISYISLAFPLQNLINDALERIERKYKLAMGITLMPYSTVGYNISSELDDPDFGDYIKNFQGSGGTYQVLHGTSVKYKDISIGLQLGYLFGNIEYQRNVLFTDLIAPFNNSFRTSYSASGFLWNTGVIYSRTLNKAKINKENNSIRPKKLSIGVYGNSKTNFSTNSEVINESIQNVLGTNFLRDTLDIYTDSIGSGTLPAQFGIGMTYQNGEKFALGFDVSYTKWAQYTNDAQIETLDDTYKVSVGGFIRPDYQSYNNYLKRIIYRYGAFYQTEPISVGSQRVKNYGASFGLGLPFAQQRKISHANLGLVVGSRGQNTPITETYFKLSFSFTYNDDEWFIKRKYN